jgi:phospholipid-transporting ATPase
MVSAVKEAIEDYRRYKMDNKTNQSIVEVWRTTDGRGAWHDVMWENVAVGDCVRLEADAAIPADMVLLQSGGVQGACSIETANLDGNLL